MNGNTRIAIAEAFLADSDVTYLDLEIVARYADGPKRWIHDRDAISIEVEVENEDGFVLHGSMTVGFMQDSDDVSGVVLEIEGDHHILQTRGEIDEFLRDKGFEVPEAPADAFVVVTLTRSYGFDHDYLAATGTVTTRRLGQNLLEPMQSQFGPVAAVSFKRASTIDKYSIGARFRLDDFPKFTCEVESISPWTIGKVMAGLRSFTERLESHLDRWTSMDKGGLVILMGDRSYPFLDLSKRDQKDRIEAGDNVRGYTAEKVLAETVLQIGDHAVVRDEFEECYTVCRIDDAGTGHPLRGNMSRPTAEAFLVGLAGNAKAFWTGAAA